MRIGHFAPIDSPEAKYRFRKTTNILLSGLELTALSPRIHRLISGISRRLAFLETQNEAQVGLSHDILCASCFSVEDWRTID
jgi:hypothetical protein